jgi:hypothetical protein
MLSAAARELHHGAVVLMHDACGPGAAREECASTVALISPLCALARARGLSPRALREGAGALREGAGAREHAPGELGYSRHRGAARRTRAAG